MTVDLKTMRLIVLIFILPCVAPAQVQPEAERLFREASQQAFERLANIDVNFDIEVSSPGIKRTLKQVSISIRKPRGARISAKTNIGTDIFILSGNSISIYDEHTHKYGTRAGVLRPATFLVTLPFVELKLPVLTVTSAIKTEDETLQIDGENFPCTTIKVVSGVMANASSTRAYQLWLDKRTGVPLKRITTYSSSSVITVVATHFATGESVPPMNFELPSSEGLLNTDDIFDDFLLAFPTNGPDFLFQPLGGPPISLPTLTGAPALLDFGSDDCAPCAADRAVFDAAARKVKEMGGRAVRVLVGDPAEAPPVESADYTTVYATPEQIDRLGIQILPSTMVVTPRGTIFRIEQGSMTEEKMLTLVELGKQQKPLTPRR